MNKKVQTIVGIPGIWTSRTEIVTSIASKSEGYLFAGVALLDTTNNEGFGLEIYDHDQNLSRAFSIAGGATFNPAQLEAIAKHTYTLYLIGDGSSIESAREIAKAVCGLLRSGGIAVKIESSGIAHTYEDWFKLTQDFNSINGFRLFVTLIGDKGTYYSCGMHNLGYRDAIISDDISPNEAACLLQTFLLYYLTENPILNNGETFSTDADSPFYILSEEECMIYSSDELFHNPFGMWRLSRG